VNYPWCAWEGVLIRILYLLILRLHGWMLNRTSLVTSLGYVFRASAYSNLYFSWNSYISSTPNALPSYSIHQSSNAVNLPDMFDARVMKMHYCHPPPSQMHTNMFGSWAPPGPAGELKCSPDSLAAIGRDGKKGREEGKEWGLEI